MEKANNGTKHSFKEGRRVDDGKNNGDTRDDDDDDDEQQRSEYLVASRCYSLVLKNELAGVGFY